MERAVTRAEAGGFVSQDDIAPEKPTQSAFIESFNSRFSDECLNEHIFEMISEARQVIKAWRLDYNDNRPHHSLRQQTITEFAPTSISTAL